MNLENMTKAELREHAERLYQQAEQIASDSAEETIDLHNKVSALENRIHTAHRSLHRQEQCLAAMQAYCQACAEENGETFETWNMMQVQLSELEDYIRSTRTTLAEVPF